MDVRGVNRRNGAEVGAGWPWILFAGVIVAGFGLTLRMPAGMDAPTCPTIRYEVALPGLPDTARSDVSFALTDVSSRTGLRFTHDAGATGREPGSILVTWGQSRSAEQPGPVEFGRARRMARPGIPGGIITINPDARLPSGVNGRRSWRGALLHELGHLLGLDHSGDVGDVMFPKLAAAPALWSPSEESLLERIGHQLGCAPGRSDAAVVQELDHGVREGGRIGG